MIGDVEGTVASSPASPSVRRSTALAVLAALNLVLTFGYQWVPLLVLGPGAETDALFASLIPPQLFLAVISGGLTAVLTPLLAIEAGAAFSLGAWTFMQAASALAVALNGLLFVTAPAWIGWIVPGFDAESRALTTSLVRIQLIGSAFMLPLSVAWAAYYARHRFVWVELSGILASAVGMGAILPLIRWYGIRGAACAMVIRAVLQLLLLLRGLGGYHPPAWRTPQAKTVWRRLLPLISGALYFKTDPIIERMLASFAPSGQLSLFHLAQQLYIAGNHILTKAVANPLVPVLARLAADGRWTEFRDRVRWHVGIVVLLTAAGSVFLVVFGMPTLRIVLVHGRFSLEDARFMYPILIALTGVWTGGAMGQVLTVGFFAYGNTSTPTRVAVFGFTVGILLKIVAFRWWGVMGLALAGSCYYWLNVCLHSVFLSRDLRRFMSASPGSPTQFGKRM